MRFFFVGWLLAVFLTGTTSPTLAAVIDFEGLSDLDAVTTQFSGLTFANATVLTAGISLNEFEFPPRSGVNVVFDDGGAVTIVFGSLQTTVSGFFNYATALTFTAFDSLNSAVGMDSSDFSSNLALSGDPGSSPNEFLGVTFRAGIKKIAVEGTAAGASFTLDDLTFTNPAASVPAPASLLLVALTTVGFIGWQRVRNHRSRSP